MKFCFTFFLFLTLAPVALAAPDLEMFRDIDGIRVYRDHEKRNIWYISPGPPMLEKRQDGSPAYSFDIYGYIGTKGTGDSGEFRVRSVLSLGITRANDPKKNTKIKKTLKSSFGGTIRLRSMPVSSASGRLLFADNEMTWSQGTRWGGKTLVLPLNSNMAQLLWDAAEVGQTLISVVIEENMPGMKTIDGKKEKNETVVSWTLPIELNMKAYPDNFAKTELGGRMVRGYTGIDVFCYDFLEELEPDLYAKIVEVAIPTTGRPLVKEIIFKEDTDYRARIDFELAKDLDKPYRIRITKIFKDGTKEQMPWETKTGETLLDITAYRDIEDEEAEEESEETEMPQE
jgi:hypothetical protein